MPLAPVPLPLRSADGWSTGEGVHRCAVLSARRTVLRGGILVGVAVLWLLVTVVTALR